MRSKQRFESRGARPMDLHAWNPLCCTEAMVQGANCTRVYDADAVDAEIARLLEHAENTIENAKRMANEVLESEDMTRG